MKAQLLPLIFLILLIGGVLLSYFFYNSFYGTKYEKSISERYSVDTLRNEIERLKGYSKQANIYSAHQALREHACLGGQIGAKEWICNGPNNFPVEDSIKCLEKWTKYYVNVYLGNYTILDTPITLIKKNFSECIYDVDPDEVLNPPRTYDPYYDEGNFFVNITDALVSVSGGGATVNDDMNIDEFITRNRYWYLFRIFHEWAEDDVYSPCICAKIGCACSSSSGEESCTSCVAASEHCAELALKDLQRRFNETEVTCHRTTPYTCCAQGRGPECLPPSDCLPWQNSICISNCKHKCIEPPPIGPLCPVNPDITLQGYYNTANEYLKNLDLNSILFPVVFAEPPPDCVCDYWYEARFASSHEFTCIDNKYHVPSDKGPVPLIFRVSAIAFWRDQDACKITNPCICPDGATTCSQCHDTCCTSCY